MNARERQDRIGDLRASRNVSARRLRALGRRKPALAAALREEIDRIDREIDALTPTPKDPK